MRFAILGLAIAAASSQTAATTPPELFHGIGRCLAVDHGQTLTAGEPLVVLGPGARPAEVVAGPLRQPVEAAPPARAEAPGWNCSKPYRAEPPAAVSELALSGPLQEEVVFAVRKQRTLLIIGGPPSRLPAGETMRWIKTVSFSLPQEWRAEGVLAQAYRYRSSSGRSAVELYLGRPTLKPAGESPAIQTITIRRLFIVDGRLLASEEYTRESGAEERVDTEGPELTFTNWSTSETERTVAFLSTNKSQTWTRLSTNIGFEGFVWIAQELRAGLPRTYDRYLYTFH